MKHNIGNSPICRDCRHFQEMDDYTKKNNFNNNDGICLDGFYINGRKIRDTAKTYSRRDACSHWVDAENGLTIYEVETCNVEPFRKGLEREIYESIIEDLRAEYKERFGIDMGKAQKEAQKKEMNNK